MTEKKEHIRHGMKSTAPADCVTEIRIGNSVLVVSGFFKQSATETAADKMAMAFLISPMGLPLAAIRLLGKVQSLKFAIQDWVYG